MSPRLSPSDSPEILGSSVQGNKHKQQEKPCQDSWDGAKGEKFLILAVGDGLGSAEHSATGSEIATTTVVDSLDDWISQFDNPHTGPSKSETESRITSAIHKAREKIQTTAEESGHPVGKYHTTLSAAVVTTNWYAAIAIGDSGLVGLHNEGEYRTLVAREETQYATQTTALTSHREVVNENKRFSYQNEPLPALAVFTDGLDRFAWALDDDSTPRQAFFDRIYKFVATVDSFTDEASADQLQRFLNSDRLNKYSGDDKTLVIGRMPSKQAAQNESEGGGNRYSNADFIQAIRSADSPSTKDITERVGCARSTTRNRLQNLEQSGRVQSKKSGRKRVWKVSESDG